MNNKYKLIVGLGNPGEKYQLNRHNIGFLIVDKYTTNLGKFEFNKKFDAEILKVGEVIFAKPRTFMNFSGKSVSEICSFYHIDPEEILVIQDELDIEFGKIKLSFDSSDAGHNGIKSITDSLGTKKYYRLRFGIGKPTDYTPIEDFVLQDFTTLELSTIKNFNLDSYLN
jgi:peptidyl-tRNA hydrolase, PTH1 family